MKQYLQTIKSSQLLASVLLKITLDSDAFISVVNEFHSIPPPKPLYNILLLEYNPVTLYQIIFISLDFIAVVLTCLKNTRYNLIYLERLLCVQHDSAFSGVNNNKSLI